MHLGDVLKRMIEVYKLKGKLHEARLRNAWSSLMGPSIAKHTDSLYLRNDCLVLRITSSSLKQELSFAKEKIIRLMNEELGEAYIKEVIIR